LSSRWLEISKESITYHDPDGNVTDNGKCHCKNGILKINWMVRYDKSMIYEIHFNSKDTVELRYHDYPYSFDTFDYDRTKEATNPTKLLGIIESID